MLSLINRKRWMIALSLSLLAMTHLADAQDVKVRAEVDANQVTLGSVVQLKITVEGTQNVDIKENLVIEGIDVRYQGPSRQISIINGQYSSSITFNYSLLALKTGKFTIPALQFDISGNKMATDPITFEVLDAASGQAAVDNTATTLQDKLSLEMRLGSESVYLQQPIPVKVFLLATGMTVADIQFPQIAGEGFRTEEYAKPKQYQQVINGVRYDVIEFSTVIYPTRAGEMTIGPATLDCSIVVRSAQPQSLPGMFDDGFFDRFFERQERRPFTLSSKPLTVNVQDVPQDGKNKDFSGAVGTFNFTASVSPTQVAVGDPLTLRMAIEGSGNLEAVTFPQLQADENLKIYDPIIKVENGVKKLEQVVIPKSDKVTAIPALNFQYFDAQAGKYNTITQGPFAVTVTPLDKDSGLQIIGMEEKEYGRGPEKIGKDIVFIKESPGKITVKGQRIYQRAFFFMPVIFVFGILIFLYISYLRTHRMETDIKYARKLVAPQYARRGIKTAKEFHGAGKTQEFYDTVYKTLTSYLANKFHLPAGAVTAASVDPLIRPALHGEEVIEQINAVMDQCDVARYAPMEIKREEMDKTLKNLEEIIDHLERNIK